MATLLKRFARGTGLVQKASIVVGLALVATVACKLVEDLPDTNPVSTNGVTTTSPIGASTQVPATATPTKSSGGETPAPTSTPTDPPPPPPSGSSDCTDGGGGGGSVGVEVGAGVSPPED